MAKTVAKKTAIKQPVKRSATAKHSGVAGEVGVVAKPSRGPVRPQAASATAVDAQVLAHGLNSLLHTMQVVQQSEETLCSLMHALRRGRATGALVKELREVLEQLPAQDYQHEVDALRDAVAA